MTWTQITWLCRMNSSLSRENSVLMWTTHFKQFWNTTNCIYLLKLYDISIIILLTNVLTNICSEISKIQLKGWVEMNVLCIVDQDYQWWVISVDHTSKCKVSYSILNQPLIVSNIGNRASLQKLPVDPTFQEKDSGYYCWKLRKQSKTLNTFQKLLE